MTLQVSKDKLRRLPYEVRLNMIKHQSDFVYEIKALIKDHPGRYHPDAEDFITNRAQFSEIVSFYSIRGISVVNLTKGLCNRLKHPETVAKLGGIRSLYIFPLTHDLPRQLQNFSRYYEPQDAGKALDMLVDTFLIINERERKFQPGTYTGLECLMGLFDIFWKEMDCNKIVDGMLSGLGQPTIDNHIRDIYARIDDPKLRSHIYSSIQIHDIIT